MTIEPLWSVLGMILLAVVVAALSLGGILLAGYRAGYLDGWNDGKAGKKYS